MSRVETIFHARRRRAEAEILADALAARVGGSVRRLNLAYRALLAIELTLAVDPTLPVLRSIVEPATRWVELIDDVRDALLRAVRDSDETADTGDGPETSVEVTQSFNRSIVVVAMFLRVTARTLDDVADAMSEASRLAAPDLEKVEASTTEAYDTSSALLRNVEDGTWREFLEQYRAKNVFEKIN